MLAKLVRRCRRITEATRFVDAAGEEVLEEALLGLFELGDEPLGRPDRLVQRIQDLRNPPLLSQLEELATEKLTDC